MLPSRSAVDFFIEDMQTAQVNQIAGAHRAPYLIGKSALYPILTTPGKNDMQLPGQFNYGIEKLAIEAQLTIDEELHISLGVAELKKKIGLPICRPQDVDHGVLASTIDAPGYSGLVCKIGKAEQDGRRPFQLLGDTSTNRGIQELDFTDEAAKRLVVAIRWATRSDIKAK